MHHVHSSAHMAHLHHAGGALSAGALIKGWSFYEFESQLSELKRWPAAPTVVRNVGHTCLMFIYVK